VRSKSLPSDLVAFDRLLSRRQIGMRLAEEMRFGSGPFWLVVGSARAEAERRVVSSTALEIRAVFPCAARGSLEVWSATELIGVAPSGVCVQAGGLVRWVLDLGTS